MPQNLSSFSLRPAASGSCVMPEMSFERPLLAAGLAVCAALWCLPCAAEAPAQLPAPPCDAATPFPDYVPTGLPSPEAWSRVEWNPPACLAWPAGRYKHVIALAGRVRADDDATLRARVGAVSASRGLRYWSVTEGAWRVLIKDASALTGAGGGRRPDFAPGELRAGATLYFVEEDNRSSDPVTYAMHVREASASRIFIETENVTPIKAMLATLFPPSSLRAAYMMTRLDARTWGLYAISVATADASGLVALGEASYANRARALYEHFAGSAPHEERAAPE